MSPSVLLSSTDSPSSISLITEEANGLSDSERIYHDGNKLHSAWTSNLLFLVGSCLYVWLAIWDILSEKSWYLPVDDHPTSRWSAWLNSYMIVSVAAASCYVIDASRLICQRSNPLGNSLDLENSNAHVDNLHNHFLHRFQSSQTVAVSVGLTFGLGATFDLIAALTSELPDPLISDWAVVGAAHSYLVNAVLLLSGKSVAFSSFSQKATVLGDFLFLIGSLVEVSLSYFYIGQESDRVWKYVYLGYLFSSILWLLNALLYIVADVFRDYHPDDTTCIIERADGVTVTFSQSNELRKDPLLEEYSLALVEEQTVDSSRGTTSSSLDEYTNFGVLSDR